MQTLCTGNACRGSYLLPDTPGLYGPDGKLIVTVAPCTAPSITAQPVGQTIASSAAADLTVTASGTAPVTYQWYEGPKGSTSRPVGKNSPAFRTPALTSATTYWVRVTNACGQADSEAVTVTPTTAGSTVYNNMIGAAGAGCYVVGQYSPGNSYILGAAFTPAANYALTQIQALMYFSSGQNDMVLSIQSDSGGAPGATMETWHLVNVLGSATSIASVNSVLRPTLVSGRRYWITAAMTTPTSQGFWCSNPLGQQGLRSYSLNGGAFTPGTLSTSGFEAFAVWGTQLP